MPRIGKLERRYYLALLSMAGVDLLLSGLFLALSGKLPVLVLRLPEVLIFLVALTLFGGYRLFTPVRVFLETGSGREAAVARAANLGKLTTQWLICVAVLFTLSSFVATPFLVFGIPVTGEIVAILAGRALAWVVLLPYVGVFVLQEYIRALRQTLYDDHDILVPAGRALLGRKFALVLLGGAIVPAVSIAITLLLVPEISPITGQPRSVVILTTLFGAAIALGLAFWATQRSTTAGFRSLLRGMRAIEQGEGGARVVIATDDELGRLGEGFNALSEQLERSREATRQKEIERAHEASRFHEAQKRDALGRLAAGIAHDFNNILAIILMYSDTVRSGLPEDDRNRKRLEEVVTAAGRGKDLISQILDFTRDKTRDKEIFDLGATVCEAASMISETLVKRVNVDLRLPKAPLFVSGDTTGIHQIVANLMINAVHAMEGEGGNLTVTLESATLDGGRAGSLRRKLAQSDAHAAFESNDGLHRAWMGILGPGDYARITVSDDGSGMSMGTLRRVFDPYFTTKAVGEGTGLGLAAVAGIAAAHAGAVAVDTAEGTGTTFRILIPLSLPEETESDG